MRRAPTSRRKSLATALVVPTLLLAACSSKPSGEALTSTTSATGGSSSTTAAMPQVRHVFVIVLENEGYDATFQNPANDPYLARTLVGQGALLQNYYGVGHFSLDDYLALISGQPPNPNTQADCVSGFTDFPATAGQTAWQGATGIQDGAGCVYPPAVQTLAGQLSAKGLTWKGYMQDMGNDPVRDGAPTSVCGHPTVNGPDPTVVAAAGDGYATRHDPFVYFHSVIDDAAGCAAHVVPLGTPEGTMPASDTVGATGLATDLKAVSTTPNFSFITPNLCNDGHDYPCRSGPSPAASSLADTDAFLKTWVPLITSSPAFKQDGLLEITFDEGDTADSSACCSQQAGPAATPGQTTVQGGGRTGAVLLSPFVKAGTVIATPFNHYSSLASFEDFFGLRRLGNAQTVPATFDHGTFGSK